MSEKTSVNLCDFSVVLCEIFLMSVTQSFTEWAQRTTEDGFN